MTAGWAMNDGCINYSPPVNLVICARYYTTTPIHALYGRLINFPRRAAIFH